MTEKEKKQAKKVINHNKRMKQETFTSSTGEEYLLTFPGIQFVEREIVSASMLPSGVRSQLLYSQNIMKHVLEGNEYNWAYFDNKITNDQRSTTITVEDFDGSNVEYKLKWPGLRAVYTMIQNATDQFGNVLSSAFFEQIMKDVITNEGINWKYWDEHLGYLEVSDESQAWLSDVIRDSEFSEVMAEADNFISKMFR